eukprot:TRINITY_DN3734_c0_g1_i1.p1 TRINITY_DN3734_c0_g1~~TRINITY_DN3734_c0_g1_i1.p1  ORF type:complete len:482 (+),score=77.88 TRINITY_DN3734_c0_g1_i1:71-1447(+)
MNLFNLIIIMIVGIDIVGGIDGTFLVASFPKNVSVWIQPTEFERLSLVSRSVDEGVFVDFWYSEIFIGILPCEYGFTMDNATVFDSTADCDDCVPDGNISYWKEPNADSTNSFVTKNLSLSTGSDSVVGRSLYYNGSCTNLLPYQDGYAVQIFYLTPVATRFANTSWISIDIQQFGYKGPFLISGSIQNGSANVFLTEVADDNLSCIASTKIIMQVDMSTPVAEYVTHSDFDDGMIPDLRDPSVRLFISFIQGESPPYCTPIEGTHDECATSPCGVTVHCSDVSTHTLGDYICTCQSPETGTPTIGRVPECSTGDDSSKMMFLFVVAIAFAVALVFLGGFLYCQTKKIKNHEGERKRADEKIGGMMSMQASQGKELSLLSTRDRNMREQHEKMEIQKVTSTLLSATAELESETCLRERRKKRRLEANMETISGKIKTVEMVTIENNKQLDQLYDKLLL